MKHSAINLHLILKAVIRNATTFAIAEVAEDALLSYPFQPLKILADSI